MRNHLMIDLETAGTEPGSAIMSIAAAAFSPYEDYEQEFPDDIQLFSMNVKLQSSIDAGLKVDGDTVMWWMAQGKEAVDALTVPEPVKLSTAVAGFNSFYWKLKESLPDKTPIYIWSHGATFDPPQWEMACRAVKKRPPWMYFNCRDTRTLFDLAFDDGFPAFEGFGTKHNAMHDVLGQIIQTQEAYRALGK